ncbi:hypothetical protein N9C31_01355 [Gammaproteobacteria bacterium]|nr:hypothetical protein [Gammaproteobacteria bacterium]
MFKDKILKLLDVYLIENQSKNLKPHAVRSRQIAQMIQWAQTCDEDILVSRLERELKFWPMPFKFFGSYEKSKSQLWRDLRSCLDAHYKRQKEYSSEMQQDRYERYEQKMTGLIRHMRDIHQEQLQQVTQVTETRLEMARHEKSSLEKELNGLKASGHDIRGIAW